MSKTVARVRPSVLPIYLAGLVWLVGGLVFPLYRLWALLLTAALSAGGYFLGKKIFPPRTVLEEVPFMTGSQNADLILETIQQGARQLHALNQAIPDDALSAAILRMETAAAGILKAVEQQPAKAKQVRRFANHYLPDAVRILTLYARVDASGAQGENQRRVLEEVTQNAGRIAQAFENQLDSLFAADALDLSTDLEVLDQMLQSQGLTGGQSTL